MVLPEREELAQRLEELEFWPEVAAAVDDYLAQYVSAKDIEMIELLLKAGANPNPREVLNCHLWWLLHEYLSTRTTHGEQLLLIMETLLKGGADPNRVCNSNYRAYDYAVEWGVEPVIAILLQHGADPKLREKL